MRFVFGVISWKCRLVKVFNKGEASLPCEITKRFDMRTRAIRFRWGADIEIGACAIACLTILFCNSECFDEHILDGVDKDIFDKKT